MIHLRMNFEYLFSEVYFWIFSDFFLYKTKMWFIYVWILSIYFRTFTSEFFLKHIFRLFLYKTKMWLIYVWILYMSIEWIWKYISKSTFVKKIWVKLTWKVFRWDLSVFENTFSRIERTFLNFHKITFFII